MATNIKLLFTYDGNVSQGAPVTIYAPTTQPAVSGLVTSIVLSSSGTPTVTVKATGGGGSAVLEQYTLGTTASILNGPIGVAGGEKLEVQTTSVSVVNVKVAVLGIERA